MHEFFHCLADDGGFFECLDEEEEEEEVLSFPDSKPTTQREDDLFLQGLDQDSGFDEIPGLKPAAQLDEFLRATKRDVSSQIQALSSIPVVDAEALLQEIERNKSRLTGITQEINEERKTGDEVRGELKKNERESKQLEKRLATIERETNTLESNLAKANRELAVIENQQEGLKNTPALGNNIRRGTSRSLNKALKKVTELQQRLNQCASARATVQAELQAAAERINECQAKINECANSLQQKEQEIETLRNGFEEKLAEKREAITSMQIVLQDKKTLIEKLEEAKAELEHELAQQNEGRDKELEQAKANFARARANVQKVKELMGQYGIDTTKGGFPNQVEQLKEIFKKLSEGKIDDAARDINRRLDELRNQLADVSQAKDRCSEELRQEAMKNLQLHEHARSYQEKHSACSAQLEELQEQIDNLTTAKEKAIKKVKKLEGELQTVNTAVQNCDQNVKKLQNENDQCSNVLRQCQEDKGAFINKFNDAANENNALHEELDDVKKRYNILQPLYVEANEKAEKLEGKNEELSETVQSLQTKNAELTAELDDLRTRFNQTEAAANKCGAERAAENNAHAREIRHFRNEVSELSTQNVKLQQEKEFYESGYKQALNMLIYYDPGQVNGGVKKLQNDLDFWQSQFRQIKAEKDLLDQQYDLLQKRLRREGATHVISGNIEALNEWDRLDSTHRYDLAQMQAEIDRLNAELVREQNRHEFIQGQIEQMKNGGNQSMMSNIRNALFGQSPRPQTQALAIRK